MTDRAQFEAMLEALINEDQETAKEIFHNIVVGKSREIYEELLAEDFSAADANKHAGLGGHQSESQDDDKEDDVEEGMEEEGMEEEGMEEEGAEDDADAEDDGEDDADSEEEPEDDGEEMPFGDEEGEEGGDMEDRVMDLEDALEDLKAEFEQLMADEEHETAHHDGMDDPAFGGDDMGGMGGEPDELEAMMEYVNKVGNVQHGDNGQNTRSAVAGKNDMGGTTANIAKNFSTTSGGTAGGLAAPTTKPLIGKVQNSPDAKAGKTGFKKAEPGHGAEKKGKSEAGVDKKSLIGGKIR
jgi:hypothetical protein